MPGTSSTSVQSARRVALHPYTVAENRAARVRARRVDGNNSNVIPLRPIVCGQAIDECALSRSRRSGHPNHKSLARVRKNSLDEMFRLRIVILDGRDRTGNGADIASLYLLGPRVDG
jgi:hypothetical protein